MRSKIEETNKKAVEAYLYKHMTAIMNNLLLENLYEKKTLSKTYSLEYVEEQFDNASLEPLDVEALKILEEYAKSNMSDNSYESTDIFGVLIYYFEKKANMH